MPDIVCAHIGTPTRQSDLGAKGLGEAGNAGAPAARRRVTAMPFTPERIL